MNLQPQTIQQKAAIVALMPLLEQRYQALLALLEESTGRDIELWILELARKDVEAVLDTMLPRFEEDEEAL